MFYPMPKDHKRGKLASKKKMLLAIRQTLKDLLYMMNNVDENMIKEMEIAIDSFIEESASQYTAQEVSEKFSTGEKAIDLLYEYVEMKTKEGNATIH